MSNEPRIVLDYSPIIRHYEECLDLYGDTHKGVDWPNANDAATRYGVMLDLLPASRPLTVLDFGCGASHLYEYIVGLQLSGIQYVGLDISPKFIQLCRSKFPHNTYICADILQTPEAIPEVDCVVMNGVFTEKCSLSAAQMLAFIQQTLVAAFRKARYGIAFNVMSAHVDWQRDDLFHLPFDLNAEFLTRHLSRHFNVRNDYGLYEYTTYVFRQKRD